MRGLHKQFRIVACMVATSMLFACAGGTTSVDMGGDGAETGGDLRVTNTDDPYNCGGPYSEAELDEAWAHFRTASGRGSVEAEAGDWSTFVEHWGNLFTEDVTYHDHIVGIMHGREAVKTWMAGWMRLPPFDTEMVFDMEWVLMDYERGWVNYKLWNRMRDPGDGSLHQVALFTNLRYGGNNQWCYEEDIYNPEEMTTMVMAWTAAKAAVARGGNTTEAR